MNDPDTRNGKAIEAKVARIRSFLRRSDAEVAILAGHPGVAWALDGGGDRIVRSAESGGLVVVVDESNCVAVTDDIEAPRVADEELAGTPYRLMSAPWREGTASLLERVLDGRPAVSDIGLQGAPADQTLVRLRYSLDEREQQRVRALGADAATAVARVCSDATPGTTEMSIAADLQCELARRGATAPVLMVASDERIHRYRHPLPTPKAFERYLMCVVVAERWGLHAALTRLVHVGPVPRDVSQALVASSLVSEALQEATRPGKRVSDVFTVCEKAYADAGFPSEWHKHHQGGAIGFAPREYIATPDSDEVVAESGAFAWNPSVTGAKCEDTHLVTTSGTELLTATSDWPDLNGATGILEVDP